MAQHAKNGMEANSGGPVQGGRAGEPSSESNVDRLEVVGGDADRPQTLGGDLAREQAAYAASIEEEIDALRVDLTQDARGRDTRDGTGRIVDELAADRMAGLTESGPELEDKGVVSAVPGRDNTSSVLRQHHPNTGIARAQDVVEGNVEEPRDEARMDRKVDEGAAA